MKRNLLVITNGFPNITSNRYNCNFVYDYVSLVKKDFDKVFVFSPQSDVPSFIQNMPIIRNFKNQINFNDYKTENIEVHYPKIKLFPFTFIFPKLKEFLMRKELFDFIDKKKDICLTHCHFIYPSGYLGALVKKQLNIPLIVTSHEGDINNYLNSSRLIRRRSLDVFKTADSIIAVSSSTKEAIAKFCSEVASKIEIINNFTDTDLFKPTDKKTAKEYLGYKDSDKIIVNVANLIVDKKGQLDAIEAISRLIKKMPNIKLILIGTGPDKSLIEEKIKRDSLGNTVFLAGPISNKDLPAWYNAADLFVFPSYYESFGIAQIEAASCNVPVIAYANNGSNEIASKGIINLVKMGDIDELTDQVSRNISLENSVDNRSVVIKHFSKEAIYQKITKLYRKN